MAITDDETRWDEIHKKVHSGELKHSIYAEEKEPLFPRGSLICDLGGGTGKDVMFFLSKGHSVILLDLSTFALDTTMKRARELGKEKNLITHQIDFGLHTLPLKDASIDVAYSRIALHYFGNSHTTKIFADIYRALKPGGKAYMTFKSPEDTVEIERLKYNAVEYEPGVYIENGMLKSRFSADQLKQIVTNAGITQFEVIPHREVLGEHESGAEQVLLQNEIVFQK